MDIKEKNKIIIDNEKFIHYLLHRLVGDKICCIYGYEHEDYFQTSYMILYRCLDKYDSTKSSIQTFIYNSLRIYLNNIAQHDNKFTTKFDISTNYNIMGKDDSFVELEELIIAEDDSFIYDIEYNTIKDKVYSKLDDKKINIYEICKKHGSFQGGKLVNASQSYCSKIVAFIDLQFLQEYGYVVYYEDLRLLEDDKLTKGDMNWIIKFDELYSNCNHAIIAPNLNYLGLYKKLLYKKYKIERMFRDDYR